MKSKLRAIAIAAATGAAIGVFWTIAVQTFGSRYWQYWEWPSRLVNWIAFATCPFFDLELHHLSIIVIPVFNSIIYGLMVYVIRRFAKQPAIPSAIILGYAVAIF